MSVRRMNATWISDTELMYRDRTTVSLKLNSNVYLIILLKTNYFLYLIRET